MTTMQNPDVDVTQAAKLLLEEHGERALEFAAGRAIECAFERDSDGAVLWCT